MADGASERCPSPDAGMELAAAARFLRNGGALVFPTETFYGLGCLAANAEAVARVYQLKQRPVHKPLPLLAAHAAQVDAVAELAAMPRGFWPSGPARSRFCCPRAPVCPRHWSTGKGLRRCA